MANYSILRICNSAHEILSFQQFRQPVGVQLSIMQIST